MLPLMVEADVAHRAIGHRGFDFAGRERLRSTLDEIAALVTWEPIAALQGSLYPAAEGEPAWPPLVMFNAMLLAVWHDLSDVKLADALDDRASFRRFCGFSATEATPERTAFVRFRRLLVVHHLDRALFDAVTAQLTAKAIAVKTGTIVDATIGGAVRPGWHAARLAQRHVGPRQAGDACPPARLES